MTDKAGGDNQESSVPVGHREVPPREVEPGVLSPPGESPDASGSLAPPSIARSAEPISSDLGPHSGSSAEVPLSGPSLNSNVVTAPGDASASREPSGYPDATVRDSLEDEFSAGNSLKSKDGQTADATVARSLKSEIDKHYRSYRRGAWWWGFCFFGGRYLITALSFSIFIVLKLDYFRGQPYQNDLASVIAAVTGLLAAFVAASDSGARWRLYRLSQGEMDRLKIRAIDVRVPSDTIRAEIDKILRAHHEGVVGRRLPNS